MSDQKIVKITYDNVPLTCPMPGQEQWNSHPRVMLPIEDTGKSKCPYCGTEYVLEGWDPSHSAH